MEVELETFAEEEDEEDEEDEDEDEDEEDEDEDEDEDTTKLGEVQELGTEILEMILEQVFGAEDVEPQSCTSCMNAEHLRMKDRTRYQFSHLKQLL
jgi:hypothetical protein